MVNEEADMKDNDFEKNNINEDKEDEALDDIITEDRKEYSEKNKPIFLPLVGLIFIVCLNFLTGVLLFCDGVILYQSNLWIIAVISAFLLCNFIKFVDTLYIDKFKWRPWLFYLFYYGLYFAFFLIAYRYFLIYIQSESSIENYFIYTAFGATLIYAFNNFHMIIIFQITVKLIRSIVITIIDIVKEIKIKIYPDKFAIEKKSTEEITYFDILSKIKEKVKDRKIRYYLFHRTYKSINDKENEKKKKENNKKFRKDKPIVFPFILLVAIAIANVYIGVRLCCNMVLFAPYINLFMLIGICIYLLLYFMPIVDRLYLENFRWRKWIFYIFYYAIQIIIYLYLQKDFLVNIKDNMQNYFPSQEEGAAYSYIIPNYIIVIFLQIVVKILRMIIIAAFNKFEITKKMTNKIKIFHADIKNKFISDEYVEEYIEEQEIDESTTKMIRYVLNKKK